MIGTALLILFYWTISLFFHQYITTDFLQGITTCIVLLFTLEGIKCLKAK